MAEMGRPVAPPNLPALVKAAFDKARVSGDITYYPTQVAVLTPGSIAFQLRYAPSLALKPKAPKPKEPNGKPFNPFENPSPAMLVAELPPSHRLVLNKFAIVPEHFILVTREFKPQTHVLEKDDIDATFACIQAYRGVGQDLFAFFNSGPHSGASQPHRHLQLLPVASMRTGLEDVDRGSQWNVLADTLTGSSKTLPFNVFTRSIRPDMSAEERHSAYLELYRHAVKAVYPDIEAHDEGEAQISYNFAMTGSTMALCPRTAEGVMLKNKSGEDIGQVSLNGTVLAGTALVKNQAEWDALREDPDVLLHVLGGISVSP
ncbi:HIT-like protein [Annulohypoxylon maeteangense]|uniref:HIT-like protein n=1 Tax=Annulohypoxylon maeteangense TaxID=1927788 RepID=UPI0020084D0C|nr:HIT-like protein [Annulohypoxylon maeteangense]KAI0887176.1 HIT-like protein [Annulohypoxylon maeteangense]